MRFGDFSRSIILRPFAFFPMPEHVMKIWFTLAMFVIVPKLIGQFRIRYQISWGILLRSGLMAQSLATRQQQDASSKFSDWIIREWWNGESLLMKLSR